LGAVTPERIATELYMLKEAENGLGLGHNQACHFRVKIG